MNMRERMLALIKRREHDRVPFVQYSNAAAPNEEIWSLIGRENMGILTWSRPYRFEHPNCRFEREEIERSGLTGYRTILHTPEGKLVEERFLEPTYGTSSVSKHFVRAPDDYRILSAYFRDVSAQKHLDDFIRLYRELDSDGLPHVTVERTPFQQLWVQWVCLEDLAYHLVDCPEVIDEVISTMTDLQRSIFELVCHAVREVPIPYVTFPDNITAPVIGEKYFRLYCVSAYDELAGMLADAGTDVPVFVHMDGDLKPLWNAIGESSVRGLDSFSPPPDNDTTVAQAAALWPEMRLLTNFPSSMHLAKPHEIYRRAEQILAEAGHSGRLQIQISENVPPGTWRKSFLQIVKAIEEFGKP